MACSNGSCRTRFADEPEVIMYQPAMRWARARLGRADGFCCDECAEHAHNELAAAGDASQVQYSGTGKAPGVQPGPNVGDQVLQGFGTGARTATDIFAETQETERERLRQSAATARAQAEAQAQVELARIQAAQNRGVAPMQPNTAPGVYTVSYGLDAAPSVRTDAGTGNSSNWSTGEKIAVGVGVVGVVAFVWDSMKKKRRRN